MRKLSNLNKIILAIEESILAHISNEDVSVTKVSQLTDRLMELYRYRDKRDRDKSIKDDCKEKKAPGKDASERVNGPDKY